MMDFSSFKPNDNHKNLKASKKPDIRIKFQTKKDRVKPWEKEPNPQTSHQRKTWKIQICTAKFINLILKKSIILYTNNINKKNGKEEFYPEISNQILEGKKKTVQVHIHKDLNNLQRKPTNWKNIPVQSPTRRKVICCTLQLTESPHKRETKMIFFEGNLNLQVWLVNNLWLGKSWLIFIHCPHLNLCKSYIQLDNYKH